MSTPPSPAHYLQYWYIALMSRDGYKFMTNNPPRVRAKLYKARQLAGDPELRKLSVVYPKPNQIWIVRREK